MPTYIYLNTYFNGYMYVGSHTWGGPEGQLDPNYHGSSHIANKYNWVPIREEILDTPSEKERFQKESFYINVYASLYGLAKVVYSHGSSDWTKKFRTNGLLINCHANNAAHLFTEETRSKTLLSRISNGYKEGAIKAAKSRKDKGTSGAVLHRYKVILGYSSKEFDKLQDACVWCESLLQTRFVRVTISQMLTSVGTVYYKGALFSYIEGTPKRPHKVSRLVVEKIRDTHIKLGNYKILSALGRASITHEDRLIACKKRSSNKGWLSSMKECSAKGNSPECRVKATRTRLLHSQLYKEETTGLVGPLSRLRTISPTLEYKATIHFKTSEEPLLWGAYRVSKIANSENYKFV